MLLFLKVDDVIYGRFIRIFKPEPEYEEICIYTMLLAEYMLLYYIYTIWQHLKKTK